MSEKERQFIVSVSPHIRSDVTVARIMWSVSISLLPALGMGLYFFGPRALAVVATCVVSCLVFEAGMQKWMGKPVTISDGSAFLTGLLLGMNLPASLWSFNPFLIHLPILGSFFAIVITKVLFGGLGYNIFNPALIGRAFLLISWPRAMTTWLKPTAGLLGMDAQTTATPLGILKEDGVGKLMEVFGTRTNLYTQLFLGHRAGSIGEVSVIALLAGGLFLLYKRYITWHIPITFLATVAILTWIFGGKDPQTGRMVLFAGDPLMHLLSGGLMLGAFFMATDYVTGPSLRAAQVLFGMGCGILTSIIRLVGGFPEGVMFAILLMNCFAPLLDRVIKTSPFGTVKTAAAVPGGPKA
ncbi:MAG: RnfABCDGE type electron transport complex subunit D [Actinomycetota bacterium]|nr:RnfABCDGE type electron transport complex subunit D [Actinomycetota bacterium]